MWFSTCLPRLIDASPSGGVTFAKGLHLLYHDKGTELGCEFFEISSFILSTELRGLCPPVIGV